MEATRTYAGWKRPTRGGLGRFGFVSTFLLIGIAIVGVLLFGYSSVGSAALFVFVAVGLLVLVSFEGPDHLSLGDRIMEWVMFAGVGRLFSLTRYRSGLIGRVSGEARLPGVAAELELFEHATAFGEVFAAIHAPSLRSVSVVLGCDPDGGSLVDEDQVDTWVARWAAWLASLSRETDLFGVQLCIETAPDSGSRLVTQLDATTSANASAFSRTVLNQVKQIYTFGALRVKGYVTLTFNRKPSGGHVRSIDETLAEISLRLPRVSVGLQDTGAGSVRVLGVQEVKELARVAYDPAAETLIDAAHAAGRVPQLEWANCGPVACENRWDHYRHDSATSVTWMMSEAPRGVVLANCLASLLQPNRSIDRKRVTLIYKVHDPAEAVKLVDKDLRAASARAGGSRNAEKTVRTQEQRDAQAAVAEINNGAALVSFGLIVTASVMDATRLSQMRVSVEQAAGASRVSLRPAYGSQDAAFAACLPIGVWSENYVGFASKISDAM